MCKGKTNSVERSRSTQRYDERRQTMYPTIKIENTLY